RLDQLAGNFIRGLGRVVATHIRANQERGVSQWSDPGQRIVHGVAARMIQDLAIPPLAINYEPTQCVIAFEMRRLDLLVAFRFEQALLPARATQLIGDELRPIAQRAMDSPRWAEHGGVVYIRAVLFHRLALRAVRPGLI